MSKKLHICTYDRQTFPVTGPPSETPGPPRSTQMEVLYNRPCKYQSVRGVTQYMQRVRAVTTRYIGYCGDNYRARYGDTCGCEQLVSSRGHLLLYAHAFSPTVYQHSVLHPCQSGAVLTGITAVTPPPVRDLAHAEPPTPK